MEKAVGTSNFSQEGCKWSQPGDSLLVTSIWSGVGGNLVGSVINPFSVRNELNYRPSSWCGRIVGVGTNPLIWHQEYCKSVNQGKLCVFQRHLCALFSQIRVHLEARSQTWFQVLKLANFYKPPGGKSRVGACIRAQLCLTLCDALEYSPPGSFGL